MTQRLRGIQSKFDARFPRPLVQYPVDQALSSQSAATVWSAARISAGGTCEEDFASGTLCLPVALIRSAP